MLFRIELCILRTEPEPWPWMQNLPEGISSLDAFKVILGVNSEDVTSAISISVSAMANAEDVNGHYLGGVVLETHAIGMTALKCRGYEKYLLQPIEMPGIFYVSGLTHFTVSQHDAAPVIEALSKLKEQRQNNKKTSNPSFQFRPPPTEPPRQCRLVCPACGSWMEIDSMSFLCSFIEGLNMEDAEHQLIRESTRATRPFIEQHFLCLAEASNEMENMSLRFVHEGEEGFDELDSSNECRPST